jgi:hypothetical protein
MRFELKFFFFLLLTLLAFNVVAAKNPIAWQLSGSFQNPVFSGATYSVTYTFTNQLPLQLVKPLVIDKIAAPANEFTYADNCSGVRLEPQQSCTVQVTLVPSASGKKSVQLVITGYNNDRVPLPALTTQLPGQITASGIQGSVTQSLPNSLTVGTQANYKFTFKNIGTAVASNVFIRTNDVNSVTTCGSSLQVGKSCTVSGTYTPVANTPSIQSVSATFNYSGGSPVTVSSSTTIPPVTGIVGFLVTPNYLPAEMVGGSRTIQYKFQNYGPTNVVITSDPTAMVQISGGSGATFTYTNGVPSASNNCTTGLTLQTNGACIATGTFTAPTESSATAFAVTATLAYTGATGSPNSVVTSTTVVPTLTTSRTVNFVNNCNFAVWFSLNGGQLDGASCNASGAGCPTGTSCYLPNHTCFWNNYAPADNNYQLDAQGGAHSTNTVTIPATTADAAIQWSGSMSASLGCTANSGCTQADCGNSSGSTVTACAAGVGFTTPVTQAEITMNLTTSDSYDVEVINGFHIPVSMVPGPYVSPSNFNCGWPGYSNAASVPTGFGACNWTTQAVLPVTAPNAYYWVTPGGTSCNVLAPSCPTTPANQVCGLDANFNQVCGNFLGYHTANEACGKNANANNAYFQCNQPVTGSFYPANSTLTNLMLCAVPTGTTTPTFNSCYLSYTQSTAQIDTCCGCADWWTLVSGVNATAQSCTQTGASAPQSNPTWVNNVRSQVIWLKAACPSDYTYTFDDPTSGFSCTNNLPGASNSVGYTVTFCPATGASTFDTGLPTGIAEGRV